MDNSFDQKRYRASTLACEWLQDDTGDRSPPSLHPILSQEYRNWNKIFFSHNLRIFI